MLARRNQPVPHKNKIRQFIATYKGYILVGLALALAFSVRTAKKAQEAVVEALGWSLSPNFFTDLRGKNLGAIGASVGVSMKRNTGANKAFDRARYDAAKANPKVYWAVYDINADRLLAASPNGNVNVYGASVPKVCVSAAAFARQGGVLPSDADYGKVIRLLVLSDNTVWDDVGRLAGGDAGVNQWAASMGYNMRPARRAGNQSNAVDMCRFWSDVCHGRFPGADDIFRITNSCQTGGSRSLRCMPSDVLMGGKTGTYEANNHDTCWVQRGDRFFAITVLTELGGAGGDAIAHMFRGLYEDYCR